MKKLLKEKLRNIETRYHGVFLNKNNAKKINGEKIAIITIETYTKGSLVSIITRENELYINWYNPVEDKVVNFMATSGIDQGKRVFKTLIEIYKNSNDGTYIFNIIYEKIYRSLILIFGNSLEQVDAVRKASGSDMIINNDIHSLIETIVKELTSFGISNINNGVPITPYINKLIEGSISINDEIHNRFKNLFNEYNYVFVKNDLDINVEYNKEPIDLINLSILNIYNINKNISLPNIYKENYTSILNKILIGNNHSIKTINIKDNLLKII